MPTTPLSGNAILSKPTLERSYSLRVELKAWEGRRAYANYATFK